VVAAAPRRPPWGGGGDGHWQTGWGTWVGFNIGVSLQRKLWTFFPIAGLGLLLGQTHRSLHVHAIPFFIYFYFLYYFFDFSKYTTTSNFAKLHYNRHILLRSQF
jgi:hypothetical protein